MLKKLLKYDLENIFKVLIIFYGLSLFFALLTRIFFSIDNSFIMNLLGQITTGVTISMIFNILINNFMRLWVRFKNNFYADEAYLTHTLPIDKKTLYLSKVITSIITLLVSLAIVLLTLFVAYYSKDNVELLKSLLLSVSNIYDIKTSSLVLVAFIVIFLEFANVLQVGYSGIICGHKMNNFKIGYSILFGFGIYMFTQILALLSIFVTGLFNPDIMNLIYTTEMIDMNTIKVIVFLTIIVYSLLLVLIYLFNLKLFKKGVNVD